MRYLILRSPSSLSEENKEARFKAYYNNHLTAPDRESYSRDCWNQIIKNNNDIWCTLDTIFFIVNDNILDNIELVKLFRLMAANPVLRKNLLVSDHSIESKLDDDRFKQIVKDERKKARIFLKEKLLQDPNLLAVIKDICPEFFAELPDSFLKELLFKNISAISLLLEPNFASRAAQLLTKKDLWNLFNANVDQAHLRVYVLILLKYAAQHQARILMQIFGMFSGLFNEVNYQEAEKLKKRVFQGGSDFLEWLIENPELFLALAQSWEIFFELFALMKYPLNYLNAIIEKHETIANWIADRLVMVCGKFLENAAEPRVDEVVKLLNNNYKILPNGTKKKYSQILSAELKEIFANLSTTKPVLTNYAWIIIECPKVCKVLALTPLTLVSFLKDEKLQYIADRLVAEYDNNWEEFINEQVYGNRLNDLERFLFIKNRLALRAHINLSTFKYTQQSPIYDYLLAATSAWEKMKANFSSDSEEQKKLSPVIRARLSYDQQRPAQIFRVYLVNFLLSEQVTLEKISSFPWQLFGHIATGAQYVVLLQKIKQMLKDLELDRDNNHQKISALKQKRSQFCHDISVHFLYKTKFISAFNRFNLYELRKFLSVDVIVENLDVTVMVGSLLMQEHNDVAKIMQRLLTNAVFKRKFLLNKLAAKTLFSNWSMFYSMQLAPLQLLHMVLDQEFQETMQYLSSFPDLFIFRVIRNLLPYLTVSQGELLRERYASIFAEMDEEVAPVQDERLEQRTRNLMINLSRNLMSDQQEPFQELLDAIFEGKVIFTMKFVPLILMLHDQFIFMLVKNNNNEKFASKFHDFLSSAADVFDLNNLCKLENPIAQIIFLRIHHRLKSFLFLTLQCYFQPSYNINDSYFLQLLFIAAKFFPKELLDEITKKKLFERISNILYRSERLCKEFPFEGQVILRLLLLKVAMDDPGIDPEMIKMISCELNFHSVQSKDELKYIKQLFPIKTILATNNDNVSLLTFFLKHPQYANNLPKSELESLKNNMPEVDSLVKYFPHLERKLALPYDDEERSESTSTFFTNSKTVVDVLNRNPYLSFLRDDETKKLIQELQEAKPDSTMISIVHFLCVLVCDPQFMNLKHALAIINSPNCTEEQVRKWQTQYNQSQANLEINNFVLQKLSQIVDHAFDARDESYQQALNS